MKSLFSVILFFVCLGRVSANDLDTVLIKSRLAALKSSVPLNYNDGFLQYLRPLLANQGNNTTEMIAAANKLMPYVEQVVKDKKMPHVLTYLPYVITGYINETNANDGKVGLWGMPYAVARKYDLLMNSYIDERYNVVVSTESAMDYLVDLKHEFNDWHLAILAFCTSPTNVLQHIYKANSGKTYEDILCDLDQSEKRYIDQLTAAAYLFSYYHEKDLKLNVKAPEQPVKTDTVDIFRKFTFDYVSSKTGIPLRLLRSLNPIYKLETVPFNEAPHSLIIPKGYKASFDSIMQNYPNMEAQRPVNDTVVILHDSDIAKARPAAAATSGSKKVPVYYKVKSGDNLYGIADLFDCTAADLKRWNKINRNYLIAGQTLVFYVSAANKAKYNRMNTLTLKQKKILIYQD